MVRHHRVEVACVPGVEVAILEGQPLGRGLNGDEVRDATFVRRRLDRTQHVSGWIARRDRADMGCRAVGDVSAAAAHIKECGISATPKVLLMLAWRLSGRASPNITAVSRTVTASYSGLPQPDMRSRVRTCHHRVRL